MESVPKSLKPKALRLMKRFRNDPSIQWNDRGELIIEGSAIPGSNMMDLVHDVLRKRKQGDPVGWQPFAKHLKHINLPMELMGKVVGSTYSRQPTGRHRVGAIVLDDRRFAHRQPEVVIVKLHRPTYGNPIKWDWCRICGTVAS